MSKSRADAGAPAAQQPRQSGTAQQVADDDETLKALELRYNEVVNRYSKTIEGQREANLWIKSVKDFAGSVNRLIVVGLGSPSSMKASILKQTAMLQALKHTLTYKGPDPKDKFPLDAFYSDPVSTALDQRFLERRLDMKPIECDERSDRDNRPDWYFLSCQHVDILMRSWDEKIDIKGVVSKTTDRTLLFMPHLPVTVVMRILSETRPAIFITHPLDVLWTHSALRKECGTPQSREHFGYDWDKYCKTVDVLKQDYIRMRLADPERGADSTFWTFQRLKADADIADLQTKGWHVGEGDMVLDLEAACNDHALEEVEGRLSRIERREGDLKKIDRLLRNMYKHAREDSEDLGGLVDAEVTMNKLIKAGKEDYIEMQAILTELKDRIEESVRANKRQKTSSEKPDKLN